MEAGKTKNRSIKESPCSEVSGTAAFIAANEEVENAYDALVELEREFQCAAAGQINRRHCGENKLLQSLNMECVNFLAHQNMAMSPEWHAAWQRFENAVLAVQQMMPQVRSEVVIVEETTVTVRKKVAAPKHA